MVFENSTDYPLNSYHKQYYAENPNYSDKSYRRESKNVYRKN